jgi:NADP-reducing hydrogenase subunit HndB
MATLGFDGLSRRREEARAARVLTPGGVRVTVHLGTCGIAAGASPVLRAFEEALAGVTGVVLTTSGCAGLCSREPMATVEIAGAAPVKYVDLTPEKAHRIVEQHVKGGAPVADYAIGCGSEKVF